MIIYGSVIAAHIFNSFVKSVGRSVGRSFGSGGGEFKLDYWNNWVVNYGYRGVEMNEKSVQNWKYSRAWLRSSINGITFLPTRQSNKAKIGKDAQRAHNGLKRLCRAQLSGFVPGLRVTAIAPLSYIYVQTFLNIDGEEKCATLKLN